METRWSPGAIMRTMLPILLVLTGIELASGFVLDTFEGTLLRYPSLLVLVPVTIGMAGNLGSILAARLSTVVHLGLLSFEPDDEYLLGNAVATCGLALTLFPLVGAGAWLAQTLVGGSRLSVGTVVLVASGSGAVLAVLAVVVTLVTTYAAYRFGLDPDDVVIPVVTNVCDVLGVVVLFTVVRLVV
ncbi:magnesium transporter [Halorientalis regularis]|jgi:mgtE-like transporter|uniref:MgtE-like transporter n=1 Tax=Halorientalis regularis TaxID=660518 RepID=A0A1G7KAM9_9EURY|nr:magnesium transporter [Halorientalis regularis]SDF34024.1 mgtE-like transporter [Halorientalis regularis]